MTKRARLIIKGNVQTVGYRAFIKLIAQNLNVKGSVRNLDNGDVELYCECDKDTYKKFKAAINRKAADKTDIMQINVDKIKEFGERSTDFDSSRIKHPFEIIYDGLKMRPFERESLERSEMAILAMTSMNENLSGKQDKMLEKQDKMLDKQDKMLDKQDQTLNAIKDMDGHMNENFQRLDEKYDMFSITLARIEVDIKEMKEAFKKLVDYLTKK